MLPMSIIFFIFKMYKKKRETQLFPATGGIWRNLASKKSSQVHATHVNIVTFLRMPPSNRQIFQ